MKVRELISELKNFDMDAEVHFSYNFGDYWRTTVAPAVENVDEGFVKHSDYHGMDKVIDTNEDETESRSAVVILSA